MRVRVRRLGAWGTMRSARRSTVAPHSSNDGARPRQSGAPCSLCSRSVEEPRTWLGLGAGVGVGLGLGLELGLGLGLGLGG